MSDSASRRGEFLIAVCQIEGPVSKARTTAERICFDQTIEAEEWLISPSLQAEIVGQIEDRRSTGGERYEVTIQFREGTSEW